MLIVSLNIPTSTYNKDPDGELNMAKQHIDNMLHNNAACITTASITTMLIINHLMPLLPCRKSINSSKNRYSR